jgi:hypothetical protein
MIQSRPSPELSFQSGVHATHGGQGIGNLVTTARLLEDFREFWFESCRRNVRLSGVERTWLKKVVPCGQLCHSHRSKTLGSAQRNERRRSE